MAAGCGFSASEASGGMLCSACGQTAGDPALLRSLAVLRAAGASDAARRGLALGLVAGDQGARERLGGVADAERCGDPKPVIVVEPPASVEIGSGPANLICEAIACNSAKVRYQWFKDGVPVPRAERSRFSLFGAGPKDVGAYVCQISSESEVTSSRQVNVTLSAAEARKTSQFEEPLRQAAEAQAEGKLQEALDRLTEAFVQAGEGNDKGRAEALCRRAALRNHMNDFEGAFKDASESVKLSPGVACAHAARGAAAMRLGLLAEAASSWETAELLGGVAEAAAQAEACRQKLNSFFEARQSSRDASEAKGSRKGAAGPESDGGDDGAAWEESWRKYGWNGPYRGGYFDGSRGAQGARNNSGGGRGHGGDRSAGSSGLGPELRSHLQKLGFEGAAGLPSAEMVRKAFRRTALSLHPDKPGGSKEAFQELQTAYEAVLRALGQA